MRKCRSCGSLLLGEADACPRCGAALEAVTAGAPAAATTRPAATAAPGPGPGQASSPPPLAVPTIWTPPPAPSASPALATPTPAAPASPVGPAAGTPAQPLPALREHWQPVAMPTPPQGRPSSTRLGIVALVVAIAVLGGLGVMHLGSSSLPKGTSDFVAGKGVTYNSPDGVYQAQFPATPMYETAPAAGGIMLARASNHSDDYEIVSVSNVAPIAIPPSRVNEFLQAGMKAEIANLNGTDTSSSFTTFAALPAIEGSFKGQDGYAARILVVVSGANVFEVVVHAKSGAARLFKAFESGLIVR